MMKKIFWVGSFVLIFLFLIFIAFLVWDYVNYDTSRLFANKKELSIKSIVDKHNDKNQIILEYAKNSLYTFENPKIIIDPYEVGFNSALLIFNTNYETEINLYVNKELIKTFDKGITHIIPIANLEYGESNIIKIENDNMTSNEFIIDIPSNSCEYSFYTKTTTNKYIYVDKYNNIYEMNALGNVYTSIYGVLQYHYQQDRLTIKTINGKYVTFLEDFSAYEENAYDFIGEEVDTKIDYKNIDMDFIFGKQYQFYNTPKEELNLKDYIKDLPKAKKGYKYFIQNDLLVLETNSDNVEVLFVNKDEIIKMKYNNFIKLNVSKPSALYVIDDNEIYDLEIVIK